MIVWEKKSPSSKIWWKYNPDRVGEFIFSFDKKTEYSLYRDYKKLTKKQKALFDSENPRWAKFFAGEEV